MPPQVFCSLSQKETLSYLIHHLQSLRTVADKVCCQSKQNKQNQWAFNARMIKEQILESVELMQKKLCFHIQNKKQLQFQDYITQFYQLQISNLRDDLNKSMNRVHLLQQRFRQACNSQELKQVSRGDRQVNEISVLEERHVSIRLRKQLAHCQCLISQNQQFIEQLNSAVKQLTQQMYAAEQRENAVRVQCEEAILKYDQKVRENGQKFRQMQRDFMQNRRVYQKQIKQLQVANCRFLEERTSLEDQVVVKSEEINLLAKRIYDLELYMNKNERELEGKKNQNLQSNQAMIFLDQEVGIWKNKFLEGQNKINSRVQSILQDKKIIESKSIELSREVEQLRLKVNEYRTGQIGSQKRQKCLKEALSSKQHQIMELQRQMRDSQTKLNSISNNCKQAQKQLVSTLSQNKSFTEQITELQTLLKQEKQNNQSAVQRNNQQKMKMKKQIYHQVEQLLRINEETVKRVRIQEGKIKQMAREIDEREKKIQTAEKVIRQVQTLNQQLIKRNQSAVTEVRQYKQIRQDLQKQLQTIKQHLQQSFKYKSVAQQQQRRVRTLQKELQQQRTQKVQLQQQVGLLQQKLSSFSKQYNQQQSSNQEISLLKQQHHKKDFVIKQLQSKITLLQEELRQTSDAAQFQREKMKAKVKELQDLVKQRYDFSNRPSNSG